MATSSLAQSHPTVGHNEHGLGDLGDRGSSSGSSSGSDGSGAFDEHSTTRFSFSHFSSFEKRTLDYASRPTVGRLAVKVLYNAALWQHASILYASYVVLVSLLWVSYSNGTRSSGHECVSGPLGQPSAKRAPLVLHKKQNPRTCLSGDI